MNSRSIRLAAGAALVALAAAGCGSAASSSGGGAGQTGRATPTASASTAAANGTATMSAAQVTGIAVNALTAAKSVRINGTFVDSDTRQNGQLDLWVTGTSGRGTISMQGAHVEIIFTNGDMYMKTGKDALKVITKGENIPAGVLDLIGDRWFKFGFGPDVPTTTSALASELSKHISDSRAKVSTGTLAGQPVTIVTYRDGSKLYVSATGPARPLQLDLTGSDGGHIVFSGYGTPVTITAPPDALDMGQMDALDMGQTGQ